MVRTLVVDDEQPARERLRQLLDEFEDVELVGEAEDGDQALERIAELAPDLVLLDIQMPGRNGLDVAALLTPPRPRIVFCTAFDQYAVDAFEQHAVDYLLKPVGRARLAKALDRVRESLAACGWLTHDLERAREVQARFYPKALPDLATLEYQGAGRPARAVSGDYYDFINLGARRLGLALGDVSGKGVPAGLLMAGLQGRLQSQAPLHGAAVAELITDLNRLTYGATEGKSYVTLFYALYDDARRRLTYVNAGHNAPMLFRSGNVHRLEKGGTVVGLFPVAPYEQEVLDLEVGDLLVCFTDGVTEALNGGGEEWGEERLADFILRRLDCPVGELCAAVLNEVEAFATGAPQHDDQTLVVMRVRV
jgi:sigma-B regulation protein RsbU (phosphoserine phosphatase)